MRYACIGVAVAACWTSSPPPETKEPVPKPTVDPTYEEARGTLRIDATPTSTRFQGVWLELAADSRWLLDYLPNEMWRSFQNQPVIATGRCYTPESQATHFVVESLRFAAPPARLVPFVELGPERLIAGAFVQHDWPAGSKRAGSPEIVFRTGSGAEYWIAGVGASVAVPDLGTHTKIKARTLVPNQMYAATPGGEHIWVVSVHDASYVERDKPALGRCPG